MSLSVDQLSKVISLWFLNRVDNALNAVGFQWRLGVDLISTFSPLARQRVLGKSLRQGVVILTYCKCPFMLSFQGFRGDPLSKSEVLEDSVAPFLSPFRKSA